MNAIVTGATSGIGLELAQGLVERGAHVGIVARNPAKARAVVERLGGGIDVFRADLAELAEVRRVAAEIAERWERVDVLVNNAGINTLAAGTTAEGFDAMVATNYLGPFLLTNLLRDRLGGGRVVNVASEAHRLADRLDPDRVEVPTRALAGNRLYGRTKLALMLFTRELAARWPDVTATSCCPGLVATNLAGERSPLTRVAGALARTPLVRRPEQGAAMPLRLATDPAMTGPEVSGRFFSSTPGAALLPPVPALADADLRRRLWERTAALVGLAR